MAIDLMKRYDGFNSIEESEDGAYVEYSDVVELITAARRLAIEADCFACNEGERDDLEAAISNVEKLTGLSK